MPQHITYLPYRDTGYFSHFVTDYLSGTPQTKPFYKYTPDKNGIAEAIKERGKYPIDRKTLVDILTKQYADLTKHEKVEKNLRLLADENTYTVCTAHQPNLLTGYLYFIYKIIHAIKLAEELQQQHTGQNFVPVYYMGSEDNDLDELGTFRYNGKKYVWDGDGQKGAVGRMRTKGLKTLLNTVFNFFGPPGNNSNELKELLTKAYLEHQNLANATQYLVNELFGRYGLIVLNPDEAAFKNIIIPIMEDDLLNETPYSMVSAQIEKLPHKAQAQPRPINLFYLKDGLRERIEKRGDTWIVVNTDLKWDKIKLLAELHAHPERFSPNVILRGLFQESILPDVAFIGGGAEVAYWLQLKTLFENYKIFYPTILLRQSVLWVKPGEVKLKDQLQLGINEIFKQEASLIKDYVVKNSSDKWQVDTETVAVENILSQLKKKATALDPTLKASSEAALAKIRYQLQVLEKKMLRAEKKKMHTQLLKITRLKNVLFPGNSLQERIENFSEYYLHYGPAFFDMLKEAMQPAQQQFLVIEDIA